MPNRYILLPKMKKLLLSSLLASAAAHAAVWHPAPLPGARETEITSSHTGHTYRIQIASIGEAPQQGYPVLYLLDGDTFFPPALIMAQSMMVSPYNKSNAPLVLVGIGYPGGRLLDIQKRASDYTPPINQNVSGDKKTGQAEAFGRFIDDELKPLIAQTFPVNSSQHAVFGHSYGGLFGTYSLFSRPERFTHYLISSPSIWWQNRRILEFQPLAPSEHTTLRISAGSLEQPASESDLRRKGRAMISNTADLAKRMERLGTHTEFTVYEGENHGSVAFKALPDGLRHLQKYWQQPE